MTGTVNGALTYFDTVIPASFAKLVFPETVPSTAWHSVMPWPIAVAAVSTMTLMALVAVLLRVVLRPFADVVRSGRTFLLVWFCLILASFATSVLWAVGMVVAAWPPQRIAFLFRNVEDILLSAGYWGIVWGWMSALVAVLVLRRQPRTEPALPTVRPHGQILGIGVVAILAAALVVVAPRATTANRAANLPDTGTVKPPVPSEPPVIYGSPTVSSSAESAESDWCHGDQVSISVGQADAATGHRALGIRLANVSEQPCVLGAYPDIAFDDATGWAVEVSAFRGGTFMTKDAGVSAFTVQPGESATASLGWNAMAPAGSTWAGTILIAPYAGTERHKVPAELDIVNGGVAAVTAWSNALDIE